MKEFFKPFKIIFYFLMLLSFFIIGLHFASAIEAGKNQGLAGGAIVLGWGVLFGSIAFISSFFIATVLKPTLLKKINWILLIIILIASSLKYNEYQLRNMKQQETENQFKPTPTIPSNTKVLAHLSTNKKSIASKSSLQNAQETMGFFTPNWHENKTLYFFGNLNLEKSLQNHLPYDSITFQQTKHQDFEIATAPPWLVPKILKMDYGILYFSVKSITQDFLEIVVNEKTQQTTYVAKEAGKLMYWPEFLLGVNSVEFLNNNNSVVYTRDFKTSSRTTTPHQFMRPVKIKGDWMEVLLLDSDFKKVGKGWIQWKTEGNLKIKYNLLS
ncbi:hypothetical protein [Ulvibacter litoralis]|uniref:Uncharacterized protein n=1 Tax=Ulvibacter litoralis TaxID=227084 RepID=A0A1G7JAZ1_9FLAO|nr:hypothetical protein [Ulvibacter litoralis]GHC64573.1 hypothetical protein GCM10008083_32260 [Ulvibacter litoralis]SDF22065.1 hypothetical protein SAMN05421855_11014 [Ulvibacter litoralis]